MAHAAAEPNAGGGNTMVAIGSAAGACIAAALGLAGVVPWAMAPVATVLAANALLFEGARIAVRLWEARSREHSGFATGVSFEVLGGIAGIALGVLAIAGLAPSRSVALATALLGSALILGSRSHTRANASAASSRVELTCGIAAVALGVAALLGVEPRVLGLSGIAAVGASVLVVSSTAARRRGP